MKKQEIDKCLVKKRCWYKDKDFSNNIDIAEFRVMGIGVVSCLHIFVTIFRYIADYFSKIRIAGGILV